MLRISQIYFDSNKIKIFMTFLAISSFIIYCMYVHRLNHNINFNNVGLDKKVDFSSLVNKKKNFNLVDASCSFYSCFDVYRCGNKGNQLLVYIYPQPIYGNSFEVDKYNYLTMEFEMILQAITASRFYTSDPNQACLFVPSLNMIKSENINLSELGRNHLIFDITHGYLENSGRSSNVVNKAIIAGIGPLKSNFRRKFDISLPIFGTLLDRIQPKSYPHREWFLTSSQLDINPDMHKSLLEMKEVYPNELQLLHSCYQYNKTNRLVRCINHSSYKYPDILRTSEFCLVLRGEKLGLSVLLEALAHTCIPVIIFDSLVMPFNEVIDWSRAAVFLREADISSTISLLRSYSDKKIKELKNHGIWLYNKYFKTIAKATETALNILADRIFPYSAKNYHSWNEPEFSSSRSPLFLPLTTPKHDGFTAVILTYDRTDLLFSLIDKISKVPSLSKILIIWNNESKRPPRLLKWPKLYRMIKIIRTGKNILSNRFYPYDEIETEAILSIDDDIIMLTEDEIEFAFEVWREFPDRLVGFPSRTHTWDNKTISWKYESEWTNRISMVLTGAAFYHKFWNYAYTVNLPRNIKEWVDDHMNCEDIAMNFLISNLTRKAPIKVTAKKKFRCPECINTESLSADLRHMVERTQCINQFTAVFGRMPLTSVEFRADPVLFRDRFPDKLKRYNNVGSL